jgi:predicted DNA-binding transcriptional regulator AlpA
MHHDMSRSLNGRGLAVSPGSAVPRLDQAKPSAITRMTLNEQELAERLGISRKTLQKWRSLGIGPAYLKLGAKVVYRVEDIEAYIQRSLRVHR